jgi:hypothetical protein
MGKRVNQARHVLDLLMEEPRTDLDGQRELTRQRPTLAETRAQLPPEELTELQREYQQASKTVLTLQGVLDPSALDLT